MCEYDIWMLLSLKHRYGMISVICNYQLPLFQKLAPINPRFPFIWILKLSRGTIRLNTSHLSTGPPRGQIDARGGGPSPR